MPTVRSLLMRRPTRVSSWLLLALVAASCQTIPDDGPSYKMGQNYLIVDEVHGAGAKGFFWLPPLVPQPVLSGSFDGTVAPIVIIEEIDTTGVSTGRTVARFATVPGAGADPE